MKRDIVKVRKGDKETETEALKDKNKNTKRYKEIEIRTAEIQKTDKYTERESVLP